MSNAIALIQTKDLLSQTDLEVLKKSKFKDFTDAEIGYAAAVSKHLQLNPLLNQIHFVKRKDNKSGGYVISTQVGIDGFRLAALRAGGYAGNDDAIFDDEKHPTKATVTVYRIVSGQRCAFTASARWDEYCPSAPNDTMWKKMPNTMLAKCAEALALRKAFPQELAGLRTDEEMEQADYIEVPSKASALNSRADAIGHEAVEENLGDFVCRIGKSYVGKKLSEIPQDKLLGFCVSVQEQENPSAEYLDFSQKGLQYLKNVGYEV